MRGNMGQPQVQVGEVISYLEMCTREGTNLQRGMYYRLRGGKSVLLMSLRRGAPYADRVEEDGRVLVYEGHDAPRIAGGHDPKTLDQSARSRSGKLTENGLFVQAAERYKEDGHPELVKVYEKIRNGIWVYNGVFKLVDAWIEGSGKRKVFKFKLEVALDPTEWSPKAEQAVLSNTRLIPSSVKLEVWRRDKGRCVICGGKDNLHFDHIIPVSKGGSSLVSANVQLLCARHNLEKRDRIV